MGRSSLTSLTSSEDFSSLEWKRSNSQVPISSIKGVKKKTLLPWPDVFLTSSPPDGARLFSPSVPQTRDATTFVALVFSSSGFHRILATKPGQLSVDETLLGTAVRLDSKPAIAPQLSLGTETVGCLDQSYQQSRPNRSDERNLA